jgi:cysteine desulfuration protein SufE
MAQPPAAARSAPPPGLRPAGRGDPAAKERVPSPAARGVSREKSRNRAAFLLTRFLLREPVPTSRENAIYLGHQPQPGLRMTIGDIVENFELLEEWDDRYRYLIELGRGLRELPETARNETNKVRGCTSQVWLLTDVRPDGAAGPVLDFVGDSDAHIVRGLIAILLALYSGKPAREILTLDAESLFVKLGLKEHLTPQRSNGFRSMVERIQADARRALAPA